MKKILIYGNEHTLVNYREAVLQCGATPFFHESNISLPNFDGLLLAGGGDIHPTLYQQPLTQSRQIDLQRDLDELRLIHLFRKRRLPILGICRGIQVINVAFGGTLDQDIHTATKHCYLPETGDQTHEIHATKKSFLMQIYGESFFVNSAHHQAVNILDESLQVDACSDDGVVEAISRQQENIYGVQFHPERMSFAHCRNDTVDGRALIEFFLGLV